MRAVIYNPYLDTLGGGERYTMAVATSLVKNGYKVYLEWEDEKIVGMLEKRFNIDLSGVGIVDDIKRGDGYDVCFWVSDGSIPLLRARNNILHFQFPFTNVNGKSLMNRMKLFRVSSIVVNSKFTKDIVDNEYGIESIVVYPPVDIESFKPSRKENIILSVGRFSQLTQSKHQDILVEVFKKMYDGGAKKWKLVITGGVEVGVDDYVKKLRESAQGYPITIVESPTFDKLKSFYAKSKIFWSASGYGIDGEEHPIKVEHFGISTVEAMSAGCVPVVFNAGGHKETVNTGNGRLWDTRNDLQSLTEELISDGPLIKTLSAQSTNDSKEYSYERFEEEIGVHF